MEGKRYDAKSADGNLQPLLAGSRGDRIDELFQGLDDAHG
jgi:hypothetical protein